MNIASFPSRSMPISRGRRNDAASGYREDTKAYQPNATNPEKRATEEAFETRARTNSSVPPSPVVGDDSDSDDQGSFKRNLQIDMKLLGDAVGNMSISPSSRDIVLAARRGLYIIDLEAPEDLPRFLPQGGTWDVADVQWHPTRAEYIISTSSEKLLIWNLNRTGKTSIDHVLWAHYRAITDINWHPLEPDLVASTGLDSWIWIWDMRTISKPVLGLSAFGDGGTQVKFNRRDENVLASSHMNEVHIWDRRKGSLPVSRIEAHKAKIYGIDWAHNTRNELVTCSLDQSVKRWDIGMPVFDGDEKSAPVTTMNLSYPVWRARDLPFGRGILSLPQRGKTALEMYAYSGHQEPIETFEGHTDVVKEFVWRRGGQDGNEFQLITWSKDSTLRFWPINPQVMQLAGHDPQGQHEARSRVDVTVSYRKPPANAEIMPTVSIPLGQMAIFDQVRAIAPVRASAAPSAMTTRNSTSGMRTPAMGFAKQRPPVRPLPTTAQSHIGSFTAQHVLSASMPARRGGTMTRGGRSSTRMDQLQWMSSIKRERKEGSASGTDSGNTSRVTSRSRPPSSVPDGTDEADTRGRHRSESRSRVRDAREVDYTQTLKEYVISTLTKFELYKVKLEKFDLSRRLCTVTCHGPWGLNSVEVFLRATFLFPRSFPADPAEVDLDKSPLIPIQNRQSIIKDLSRIIGRHRRCLEPCLNFLKFGDEKGHPSRAPSPVSESSSDEEASHGRGNQGRVAKMIRSHKNLAEPRTSQGVFCANGNLVCFFRAPPRIVRNAMQELTNPSSSSIPSRAMTRDASTPGLLQSPGLVSDAVHQLVSIARDRPSTPLSKPGQDASNILRIMTNLLTFPGHRGRRGTSQQSRPADDTTAYQLLSTRLSKVVIHDASMVTETNENVAQEYVLESLGGPSEVCRLNSLVAARHSLYLHQRIFTLLEALCRTSLTSGIIRTKKPSALLMELHAWLLQRRDVQALGMFSAVVLLAYPRHAVISAKIATPSAPSLKSPTSDYFSMRRRKDSRPTSRTSPAWMRVPSDSSVQATPIVPSLSHSTPNRGSWSSLFNARSSVRQLLEATSAVPTALDSPLSPPPKTLGSIPVPLRGRSYRGTTSPLATVRPVQTEARSSVEPLSNSWSVTRLSPTKRTPVSFSSSGHGYKRTISQTVTIKSETIQEKRMHVVKLVDDENSAACPLDDTTYKQLVQHIRVYSDQLFSWQLFQKRAELLKLLGRATGVATKPSQESPCEDIGVVTIAPAMQGAAHEKAKLNETRLPCTFCRLPVHGLAHICTQCGHVTHVKCWRMREWDHCSSGCGCPCAALDRPSHQSSPIRESIVGGSRISLSDLTT